MSLKRCLGNPCPLFLKSILLSCMHLPLNKVHKSVKGLPFSPFPSLLFETLGIEPTALCMLGKCSTVELSQSFPSLFWERILLSWLNWPPAHSSLDRLWTPTTAASQADGIMGLHHSLIKGGSEKYYPNAFSISRGWRLLGNSGKNLHLPPSLAPLLSVDFAYCLESSLWPARVPLDKELRHYLSSPNIINLIWITQSLLSHCWQETEVVQRKP